ncbi:MAG: amino acid adenylation domain-containing protein [bacterium]
MRAPVALAQESIWFVSRYAPDSPVYNLPIGMDIRGDLNVEALNSALTRICERHPALRSVFREHGGRLFQVVQPRKPVNVQLLDLCSEKENLLAREVERKTLESCRRVFHLGSDLMLRATLIRVRPQQHRLILTLHHIVSDGWSLGVIMAELAALYRQFSTGESAKLDETNHLFSDFCWQQRKPRQDLDRDERFLFWQQNLESTSGLLDLPRDHPRPLTRRFEGKRIEFEFDADSSDRIRRFVREKRVTVFTYLLTVLQILLYRLSGQDDILVGVPALCRDARFGFGEVGLFANTVVHRMRVKPKRSFSETMLLVQSNAAALAGSQDFPFEKLVELLEMNASGSTSPLVQVMFNFQSTAELMPDWPGLEIKLFDPDTGSAKFDLLLAITEFRGGGIKAQLEYDADLFDEGTADGIVTGFRQLVLRALESPERSVSTLPLVGKADALELRKLGFGIETNPHIVCGVHQYLERMAIERAEQPAIVGADGQYNYADLNTQANRVAHYLLDLDIEKEEQIGIRLERGTEFVIALLAVLKAGKAYLPIDPALPAQRQNFMMQDSGTRTLLAGTRDKGFVNDNVHVVEMSEAIKGPDSRICDNPDIATSPEDNLYMMYTSGTTGNPKGIEQTHRTLINLAEWHPDEAYAGDNARKAQLASIGFDVSALEIVTCWRYGACLYVLPDNYRADPRKLLKFLIENQIDSLNTTSAVLDLLAQEASRQHHYPTALKEFITSGDQLIVTGAIRDFFKNLPGCIYRNQYGPTETHVVTCYSVNNPSEIPGYVPIGRPIWNTNIYIVDANRQLLPRGVTGEIIVSGAGLARGYHNGSPKDLQRFIEHFDQSPGIGKAYVTGDFGKWLESGDLKYRGRHDRQLKVNGFRIEPEEVERRLLEVGPVQKALCAKQGDGQNETLVAYVVMKEGVSGSAVLDLRDQLAHLLPQYMLPARFVQVRFLPININGKLDEKLVDEVKQSTETSTSAAPANPDEEAIGEIWKRVLLIDSEPDVEQDFFAAGGTSLSAVRFLMGVEKKFERNLSLAGFLRRPTIRELAKNLTSADSDDHSKESGARDNAEQFERKDLFHQQRLYTAGWKGSRSSEDALSVQLGTNPGSPYITWGCQDFGEAQTLQAYFERSVNLVAIRSARFFVDTNNEDTRVLAERYAKEIMEMQPIGPYQLGGFCLGGKLALYTAQALQRAGGVVDRVIVLEAVQHIVAQSEVFNFPVILLVARDSRTNPFRNDFRPLQTLKRYLPQLEDIVVLDSGHSAVFEWTHLAKIAQTFRCSLKSQAENTAAMTVQTGDRYLKLTENGYGRRIILRDLPRDAQPMTLARGERFKLTGMVVNTGSERWLETTKSGIYLSNCWLEQDSGMVLKCHDDPAMIESPISPKMMATFDLNLTAPRFCGRFRLAIDLIEDGIRWFRINTSRKRWKFRSLRGELILTVEVRNESAATDLSLDSSMQRANQLYYQGAYSAAADLYEGIIAQLDKYDSVLEPLADCYLQLNIFSQARLRYEELDQLQSLSSRAAYNYARTLVVDSEVAKAAKVLERSLAQVPAQTALLYLLSLIYLELGQHEKALLAAEQAVNSKPRALWSQILMAEINSSCGNRQIAIKYAKRAIQTDRLNIMGYLVLAEQLSADGDYDQALEVVESGLMVAPDSKIGELALQKIKDIKAGRLQKPESLDRDIGSGVESRLRDRLLNHPDAGPTPPRH